MNQPNLLDFRFYDIHDEGNINVIYIDEENPASISLKFEIQNKSEVDLELKPDKVESESSNQETYSAASPDNYHVELRFRPGTLSTASLVQLDLDEYSQERWKMSRPFFHENREVSLYFLRYNKALTLPKKLDNNRENQVKESLTLRGFAANSAGGVRATNVIISYQGFSQSSSSDDTTGNISGTQLLTLTILAHRGERKAPLAISFATHNSILNTGETGRNNNIRLQVTNISSEAIALSHESQFIIEIDAQSESSYEPSAVAKKDEAKEFTATILNDQKNPSRQEKKSWYWKSESSGINKNLEEPRFIFKGISRHRGSSEEVSYAIQQEQQYIETPNQFEAEVIMFTSDPDKSRITFPGTEWKTKSGYRFCFQKDGDLVLYNQDEEPLWATGTTQEEYKADLLKFKPNGNLVLYRKQTPLWSTHTSVNSERLPLRLELKGDGNLVILESQNPEATPLFETQTQGGKKSELNAYQTWEQGVDDEDDEVSFDISSLPNLDEEYSFPSNEDLIFELSNVKSTLKSGQGQIRVYYKNIPGYADGSEVLDIQKTRLVERDNKIGIGKFPEKELDVKGDIQVTQKISANSVEAKSAVIEGTVSADFFEGKGAVVKGMIVMWSGSENKIPDGWKICNGQEYNGSKIPDLRGRFILGADSTNSDITVGKSGDPDTHSIDSFSIPCKTKEAGEHQHKFPKPWYYRDNFAAELQMTKRSTADYVNASGIDVGGKGNFQEKNAREEDKSKVQSSGSHAHSVTIDIPKLNINSSSGENRPKWYALCFIMYVG